MPSLDERRQDTGTRGGREMDVSFYGGITICLPRKYSIKASSILHN